MNAEPCPEEADLLAWADHAQGSEAIGAHVDTCSLCRQRLADLQQALTQVRLRYVAQHQAAEGATGSAATPASLGKYLVVGRLASPSRFESFRGLHPLLHVDLRIDLGFDTVPNIAEYREPIAAEMRRLMAIEHPQLSRIRDSGFFDDRLYLVADFGQEERLDRRLSKAAFASDEAAGLVSALAQAAVPLAEAGIFPREIHPSGILLRENADPLWTDWGAASALCPHASGVAAPPVHQLLACLFVDLVLPHAGTRHEPASARTAIDERRGAETIPAAMAKCLRHALDVPVDSSEELTRLSRGLQPRTGFWSRMTR